MSNLMDLWMIFAVTIGTKRLAISEVEHSVIATVLICGLVPVGNAATW